MTSFERQYNLSCQTILPFERDDTIFSRKGSNLFEGETARFDLKKALQSEELVLCDKYTTGSSGFANAFSSLLTRAIPLSSFYLFVEGWGWLCQAEASQLLNINRESMGW